jgi:hypothetical protein
MTIDSGKQANPTVISGNSQSARTDDLLASGPDSKDGARGFGGTAAPEALQTGMEGIAQASVQGNKQSDSHSSQATSQTVPDNPGQVRGKQENR